jgi:hypothetical protein
MSVVEPGWWPRFTMSILAVWRVTHLLALEDGPADLVFRLRAWVGNSAVGRAMDCFYCLSVWIALPFALLLTGNWLDRMLGWLALSGAACLLEKLVEVTHVLRPKEGDDGESGRGEHAQSVADSR